MLLHHQCTALLPLKSRDELYYIFAALIFNYFFVIFVVVCLYQGLDKFSGETTLLTGIARIYEELQDMNNAVKYYKDVLHFDNTHVEAIACIATNHFYTDQPEIALRFYRSETRQKRLLISKNLI